MASVDRLSNLPDAIICHILSFLPTKLSVSTSVLSKRWSSLWAHVPVLDFESGESTALDIVTRFMQLYKVQRINAFRISYAGRHDDLSKSQLETCIAVAILHNVKELRVCVPVLPRGILTCETLVDLCLRNCGDIIPVTDTVCLPALKTLHLISVKYKSDKTLVHLLSGCPVLEELTVRCFPTWVCCHITSPTLKKLTINDHCKVKVDTPSLRFLKLENCVPLEGDVSDGTLDSLTEAEIDIDKLTIMGLDVAVFSHYVLRFVSRLNNVKYLKLSSLLDPNYSFSFLPSYTKFHNLTRLELNGDGRFLSYFLANADNLEVLIIGRVKSGMWLLEQETKCLSSHLRAVRIGGFGCAEHEFELIIRYLLWNAKVLRRMEIYSSRHDGTDLKAKFDERISLFPRGSVACELAFH
ncbi:F-box/LRR-repeat protein at4g14096 [Phtheirospermum japonicum]|uniref:F-box/LRR-repeat protein at4g14096 n=1 Tax=Phtheirospermum japonicum TaxID=374723 RepID=A0A830BQB7_9LAMI|nr:F-box/LRR-repeat protein at4g14096 [Phtheirospermum japonicum]GFP87177.1 F-box/LRR-repeat protein at4g14096 [Phtheirospermum japonicum]